MILILAEINQPSGLNHYGCHQAITMKFAIQKSIKTPEYWCSRPGFVSDNWHTDGKTFRLLRMQTSLPDTRQGVLVGKHCRNVQTILQ